MEIDRNRFLSDQRQVRVVNEMTAITRDGKAIATRMSSQAGNTWDTPPGTPTGCGHRIMGGIGRLAACNRPAQ